MADMTVANEIARQIGGRALYMMGAKGTVVGMEKGITFKVGCGAKYRGGKAVTHVRITLTPEDTYDIEFVWCRGADYATRGETKGAYVDMLHEVLAEGTGMALAL